MSRALKDYYIKVTIAGTTSYFTTIKDAADKIGVSASKLRYRLLHGGFNKDETTASFISKNEDEVAEFKKQLQKESLYVDPIELKKEIEISQSAKVCTERLGQMCLLLCRKITFMPQFLHYTFHQKEEMSAEAVERLVTYTVFRADTSKNVFAFLSLAIINVYKSYLSKFYRDKNYRLRYMRDMLSEIINDKDIQASGTMKDFYRELCESDTRKED